jgi:hypothetical protein
VSVSYLENFAQNLHFGSTLSLLISVQRPARSGEHRLYQVHFVAKLIPGVKKLHGVFIKKWNSGTPPHQNKAEYVPLDILEGRKV